MEKYKTIILNVEEQKNLLYLLETEIPHLRRRAKRYKEGSEARKALDDTIQTLLIVQDKIWL